LGKTLRESNSRSLEDDETRKTREVEIAFAKKCGKS
jgi:hypothetical protein